MEELTGYSSFGSGSLLIRIVRRICESEYSEEDLRVILSNDVPTMEMVDYPAAMTLLRVLGLCVNHEPQGNLSLCESLDTSAESEIAGILVQALFDLLAPLDIFNPSKLVFDRDNGRLYLPLHRFPMKYAPFRNLLVDLEGLEREGKRLYLSETAKNEVASTNTDMFNGMSPEQLMKRLEQNRIAGEKAEQFVMEYERRRLGEDKGKEVQQVSVFSVSAGFDIASFESAHSLRYDRLIEVKATGKDGFYLSSNELDVARMQGSNYYLYLVNLGLTNNPSYEPTIIKDPADYFTHCDDWRIKPSGYHIIPLN